MNFMEKSLKISIIVGTRPEIIKMAPIIKLCQKRKINFFILHTGQHYSENLDKVFFDELGLPRPKYNLKIGSGTHGYELGRMIFLIEKVLIYENPDIVLVEGDTNTVLAGALAASKLQIKIGHIEAGLRSYSKKMPEETNRILTDHCSDYLFAPTIGAKRILAKEGILKDKVFITGNTITDAVSQNLKIAAKKSKILKKLGLNKGGYFVLTLHRPENVDSKSNISNIFLGLSLVHGWFGKPIIFSAHPRAEKNLDTFNIPMPSGLKIIKPLGYMDFLKLQSESALVLTDSGGIQEEACILKVPCVTLRENTERPETINAGANVLAGTDPEKIFSSAKKMINRRRMWKNPLGNGRAAEQIISVINRMNNGRAK